MLKQSGLRDSDSTGPILMTIESDMKHIEASKMRYIKLFASMAVQIIYYKMYSLKNINENVLIDRNY